MGKRLLLVVIGVFVSALGFAQRPPNNARGPVILVDQPGPEILSENPAGHYTQTDVSGDNTHGFGLSGYYTGGGDGEEPGARVVIDGGVIHGRVSGRDCLNQTIKADIWLTK
jgi:hypothetical protein